MVHTAEGGRITCDDNFHLYLSACCSDTSCFSIELGTGICFQLTEHSWDYDRCCRLEGWPSWKILDVIVWQWVSEIMESLQFVLEWSAGVNLQYGNVLSGGSEGLKSIEAGSLLWIYFTDVLWKKTKQYFDSSFMQWWEALAREIIVTHPITWNQMQGAFHLWG